MFCKFCGAYCSESEEFCSKCGKKVIRVRMETLKNGDCIEISNKDLCITELEDVNIVARIETVESMKSEKIIEREESNLKVTQSGELIKIRKLLLEERKTNKRAHRIMIFFLLLLLIMNILQILYVRSMESPLNKQKDQSQDYTISKEIDYETK